MKGDFVRILIPKGSLPSSLITSNKPNLLTTLNNESNEVEFVPPNNCESTNKSRYLRKSHDTMSRLSVWLALTAVTLTLLFVVGRHEIQLRKFDEVYLESLDRITALEAEIQGLMRGIVDGYGGDNVEMTFGTRKEESTTADTNSVVINKDAASKLHRTRRDVRYRSNLQIAPTYGPEVARTEDGVPVLSQSYFRGRDVNVSPVISVSPTQFHGRRVDGGRDNDGPVPPYNQLRRSGIQTKSSDPDYASDLSFGGNSEDDQSSEEYSGRARGGGHGFSTVHRDRSATGNSFQQPENERPGYSGRNVVEVENGRATYRSPGITSNIRVYETNSNGCTACTSGSVGGSSGSTGERSSYSSGGSSYSSGGSSTGYRSHSSGSVGGSGRSEVFVVTEPTTAATSPTYDHYERTTRQTYIRVENQHQTRIEQRNQYPSAEDLIIGGGSGRGQEPDIARTLQIPNNVLRTSGLDLDLGKIFTGYGKGCRVNVQNTNAQSSQRINANSQTGTDDDDSNQSSSGPCINSSSYNYTSVQEYDSRRPDQNVSYVREYSSNPRVNFTLVRPYTTISPQMLDVEQTQSTQTRRQQGHGQIYSGGGNNYGSTSRSSVGQSGTSVVGHGGVSSGSSSSDTRTRNVVTGSTRDVIQTRSRHVEVEEQEERKVNQERQYQSSCRGPRPLAAHYVAEIATGYNTRLTDFDARGRLRNDNGIFEGWKPAEWMTDNQLYRGNDDSSNFVLSTNGVLTVRRAGLYYIYAQIHYEEEEHQNGFIVEVNSQPFLQCTRMTSNYVSSERVNLKFNSCFTAGLRFLDPNDQIKIRDIERGRYSVYKPEKSFFGLMNIGGDC